MGLLLILSTKVLPTTCSVEISWRHHTFHFLFNLRWVSQGLLTNMKKLLLLLFGSFCCICSVCGQTQTVLHYEQLLDTACIYLEKNMIEEGESILMDLEANQEVPERLRLNATLVLANLYVNLDEADKLQESLLILDDYLQLHPEKEDIVDAYRKYEKAYASIALYGTPFEERMCGLWVSANCDDAGIPSVAVEIGQDSVGKYRARLVECCSLARVLSAKDIYEEHQTPDLDFLGGERKLQIFFGDEKLRKGNAGLAAAGVAATNQITRSVGQAISTNNKKNLNSVGNIAGHAAVNMGGMLVGALFASMAIEKKYVKILEMDMQEMMPGMVSAVLRYEYHLQSSDGKNEKGERRRSFNLYQVTAADSIFFTTQRYDEKEKMRFCFGCVASMHMGYSDEQKAALNKLRAGVPLKDEKDMYCFNQDAYKRLHRKIADCSTLLPEEDLEKVEKDITFDFKYAVLHQVPGDKLPLTLKNMRRGYFTGITQQVYNNSGHFWSTLPNYLDIARNAKKEWYKFSVILELFQPVYGKFESLKRDKKVMDYEGEWQSNRTNACYFHGFGTLTTSKGTYTGEFVKGRRHGKGRFVDVTGNVQEGIWKKDKLIKTKKMQP